MTANTPEHVLPFIDEHGVPTLFNLVTSEVLTADTPQDVLEARGFTGTSWSLAVRSRLFRNPKRLNLNMAVTWKCSLRCPHCFVLHTLVPDSTDEKFFSFPDLEAFIRKYLEVYPSINDLGVGFVGGEVMLNPGRSLEILRIMKRIAGSLNLTIRFSCTTNLAYELTSEIVEFLSCLDEFMVSIDGLKEHHDAQRFSSKIKSPFTQSVSNLYTLVSKHGLIPTVQCVVPAEVLSEQFSADYLYVMRRLGIPKNKVKIGAPSPTPKKPQYGQINLDAIKSIGPMRSPCCAYRFMVQMNINPDGSISADYHNSASSVIGHIKDTDIHKLAIRHKQFIESTMDVLKDPGCQGCPVIAYCWGQCVTTKHVTNGRPSLFCGRERLIEVVTKDVLKNFDKSKDP